MAKSDIFKLKTIGLVLPVLVSIIFPLCAGAAEGPAVPRAVDFNIRFYDRRVYFAEKDPIYVQVTITNNSPHTYRFKLADERAFSIDFDIRTVGNRSLAPADSLVRKRTQYQQIFFREITVESGEAFSFVEDLKNYVDLRQSGSFVVQARVYPELYRSAPANAASLPTVSPTALPSVLESNSLNLNIRPPLIPGPNGVPLPMDIVTNAVLVREKLSPDRVVDYMLTARQKSQWERFFLYLDLETMIARDAVRSRKWIAEGEEGRQRMLEQYRVELQNSVNDGDISVIPTEFLMERTQYNNFEGTVTVLEKFRIGNFTELKRYTYFVRQKDDIWTIVDYSVVNLGTE